MFCLLLCGLGTDHLSMLILINSHLNFSSLKNSSWLGSFIGTVIGNIKLSIGNIHIRYEDIERYSNFCLVNVSFRVHIRKPCIVSVAIQATLLQQVWYFQSCQQLLWMTMGRKLSPLVEIWTEWRRYILLTSQHFVSVINLIWYAMASSYFWESRHLFVTHGLFFS
jgi:hypothetical protein